MLSSTSSLQHPDQHSELQCSSHGKPLEVYCDTCNKLICQHCTVEKHQDHKCDTIANAFPRHKKQILDSLQQVEQKLATATQSLKTQGEGSLELVGSARRDIGTTVQHLIQLLQESERQLIRQLDQVTNVCVFSREKEANNAIAQLKSCKELLENMKVGSQQEILVMKGQMLERMVAVCSQVKDDSLQPLEDIRVKFVKSTNVLEACRSLGSVVRYGQFKAACDKASFDLCSAAGPLSSELVSCYLSPVADPTLVVNCIADQVAPGSFEVHHSSPVAGLHQLRVQVGGTDILETPLNVEIMPRKAGQTFTDLSDPTGLAFTNEGHLIVAERGKHCITVIDPANGRKIRSIGRSLARSSIDPHGVAVTQDGNIVVADRSRLLMLTSEGAFLSEVGGLSVKEFTDYLSKGLRPLSINPWDVAVHSNGNVYATNARNCDRVTGDPRDVVILNADFSYSHCIVSKGDEFCLITDADGTIYQPNREFDKPRGITIDAHGMVYIADSNNHRVQKYSSEGELLTIISSKGEGGGRLNEPYGLCVDGNGILYVTENGSNTVSMFTSEGRFLGYIGDSDGSSFNHPQYIVSDKTGRLYISDKNGVHAY